MVDTKLMCKTFYYRPQTKFGQGNIFAPVCHSVHRGVPGPKGVSATGGVCSWGGLVPGGGGLLPGGSGPGVPGGDPPGTATAAGGTHPTGMHSC